MILAFYVEDNMVKEGRVSDFICIPRIGEEVRIQVHGYYRNHIVKNVVWFMDETPTVEIYLEEKL